MTNLATAIYKDPLAKIALGIYLIFSTWWIIIFLGGTTDAPVNHWFGFAYGGFSLIGSIIGLISIKHWGGYKSLMGKAMLSLSLGLFAQAFGQYSFWFLQSIMRVELPYPSISDIGFFGTNPFYIYAAFLIAKASGVKLSVKSFSHQISAVIIPTVTLLIAYFLFLREYQLDMSQPLLVFFDLGYPLAPTIYISIAILTYGLSRNTLGGIMKSRILFLIIAFFAQFVAEYLFIYFQEDFFPASFVDFAYLTAYFIMTMALLQLKWVSKKLNS